MSDNLNTDHCSAAPTAPDYVALVDELREAAVGHAATLLDQLFADADDTLFTLAEKADNNHSQQAYFDTMRALRLERDKIAESFSGALRDSLQSGAVRCAEIEDDDDSLELSLVDQDAMEEMVAIRSMAQRADQLFREALIHFGQRLAELTRHTRLAFAADALAPKALCEHFRDALTPLGISLELQHRLILYKLFDQQVATHLDLIYDDLNQRMSNAGLLSKNSYRARNRDGAGATVGGLRHPSTSPPGDLFEAANQAAAQAASEAAMATLGPENYRAWASAHPGALDFASWQALNRFVGLGSAAPASGSTAGAAHAVSRGAALYSQSDLLEGLSRLQRHSTAGSIDNADARAFDRALLDELGSIDGGGNTRQLGEADQRVISLVQGLIDQLQQQAQSAVSAPLFNQLQVPLMKVVLLDRSFFTRPQHPARDLLDTLADIAPSLEDSSDPLYRDVKQLVDEIASDDGGGETQFQRGVDRLHEMLRDEERRAREAERQTQREALRKHARVVVLHCLRERLGDRRLPSNLNRLVLKHWATLLYRCYIKRGRHSPDWQRALEVLELLLASVQPVDEVLSAAAIQQREAEWALVAAHCRRLLRNSRLADEDVVASTDNLRAVHAARLATLRRLAAQAARGGEPASDATVEDTAGGDRPDNAEIATRDDSDETCDETSPDGGALHDAGVAMRASEAASATDPDDHSVDISGDAPDEHPGDDLAASGDGAATDAESAAVDETQIHIEPLPGNPVDDAQIDQQAALAELPENVRPGNWLLLDCGADRARRRLKLSVIISDGGLLVFVDRRGKRALDKTASQLLEELADGRSEVIMEFSAFDRALSSVINDLAVA